MPPEQGIPEIRAHFPRWQLKMGLLISSRPCDKGIPEIRAHFLRWAAKGYGLLFQVCHEPRALNRRNKARPLM
jgi:hypothetical protein